MLTQAQQQQYADAQAEYIQKLKDWEDLCQAEYDRQQEEYNAELQAKREAIIKQFDELVWPEELEQAQQDATSRWSGVVDNEDNLLPRTVVNNHIAEDTEEFKKTYEQRKERYVRENAYLTYEPWTLDYIQNLWSHLKPTEPDEPMPVYPPIEEAVYKLNDGSYYSVENACFLPQTYSTASTLEAEGYNGYNIIELDMGPEDFRKNVLEFYKAGAYPNLKIGIELLSLDEVKQQRVEELNAEVTEAIEAGFAYTVQSDSTDSDLYFSFDADDQRNFQSTATATQFMTADTEDSTISWQGWNKPHKLNPDAEPVQLQLTPAAFTQLYTEGALAHLNSTLAKGRDAKARVRAATTKEDALAVSLMDV